MTKIFLSPSDQVNNAYSGSNTNESAQCVKIANACKKYLEMNGYSVKVGSPSRGYTGRVLESNSWGADIHIPIHTNAGGGDGTLVMTYSGSVNDPYVRNIYNEVAKVSPGNDDGIRANNSLYEIMQTSAVCVYVECEFHDNSTLAHWIENNTDTLGKAIAKGVCFAEGKTFKDTAQSVTPPTPSGTLYKVQCGAYSKKSNADNLASNLKKCGFDSYIYRDTDGLYKVQCGAYSKKENAEKQVQAIKAKGFSAYAYKE